MNQGQGPAFDAAAQLTAFKFLRAQTDRAGLDLRPTDDDTVFTSEPRLVTPEGTIATVSLKRGGLEEDNVEQCTQLFFDIEDGDTDEGARLYHASLVRDAGTRESWSLDEGTQNSLYPDAHPLFPRTPPRFERRIAAAIARIMCEFTLAYPIDDEQGDGRISQTSFSLGLISALTKPSAHGVTRANPLPAKRKHMGDLSENWEGEAPLDRPFGRSHRYRFVTALLASEGVTAVERNETPAITDADVRRLDERSWVALRISADGDDGTVTLRLHIVDRAGKVMLEATLSCLEGEPLAWETTLKRLSLYDGPSPGLNVGRLTHAQAVEAVRELARISRALPAPAATP